MHKYFFTYLLTFALVSSIVAPTCFSFCELNYELSLEIDIEEESEKTKEIEIKMFHIIDNFTTKDVVVAKNDIIFFSKDYTSIHLSLDSPPPRLIG